MWDLFSLENYLIVALVASVLVGLFSHDHIGDSALWAITIGMTLGLSWPVAIPLLLLLLLYTAVLDWADRRNLRGNANRDDVVHSEMDAHEHWPDSFVLPGREKQAKTTRHPVDDFID